MTTSRDQSGYCVELERTLPNEVKAISPFVDEFMFLIRKCGCVPEGETHVEIALREALANAIIHGNQENSPKHVHVTCRCKPEEVSIAVKDEGREFDIQKLADPTDPQNIRSVHGRGIYLMRRLTEDMRFEEDGAVVRSAKERQPSGSQRCTPRSSLVRAAMAQGCCIRSFCRHTPRASLVSPQSILRGATTSSLAHPMG
jgi:anti-sigma regulatory factor (Ser/Thr protein kinase)